MTALSTRPRTASRPAVSPPRTRGLPLLMASEALSGILGFLATLHIARSLGPSGFASLELALAVSAWMLVLVRGGIEIIVHREAARRPRLVHPLTRHLLGLRLLSASIGYISIFVIATSSRLTDPSLFLLTGLVLWPSALASDVAPRSRARLFLPACAQAARACAYALAAFSLVSSPADLRPSALCLALAESVSVLILLLGHSREFGLPFPQFHKRLWIILLYRGTQTTLLRFLRVGLYGADILALGWLCPVGLGPYAAARRVVFALLAVGLVAPSALGPVLARAWSKSTHEFRSVYQSARLRILALALPCACGLALTSGRVLSTLFGPDFQAGGPLLALVAFRLPWMLLSGLDISALVACRRERHALGLVGSVAALAAVTLPLAASAGGAVAVGLTLLLLEALGSLASSRLLRTLGISVPPWLGWRQPMLACSAMTIVCLLTRSCPLPVTCGAGALVYLAVWRIQTRP